MSPRLIGATLAFVVGFPLLSVAGPIQDFSTLAGGTGPTYLSSPQTLPGPGGITANAYVYDATAKTWGLTELTVHNVDDDHGLGVCSEGETNCTNGTGDVNEISQLTNSEALLLSIPDGYSWTSLWVSSLDSNNNTGDETGTVVLGHDERRHDAAFGLQSLHL